ncbi:Uncharacterised protein [Vibrio cholerae]|nr:Uncharacterised protein [Vibrio cholerae]CSI47219.1 Uncharacterised protein [Vibrio cholerae]
MEHHFIRLISECRQQLLFGGTCITEHGKSLVAMASKNHLIKTLTPTIDHNLYPTW